MEYRIIDGTREQVELQFEQLWNEGWKPLGHLVVVPNKEHSPWYAREMMFKAIGVGLASKLLPDKDVYTVLDSVDGTKEVQ